MTETKTLPVAGGESVAALSGIRVLDLATFIAAPYCATLLGEFGAEVIKVELPKVGDPLRKFGTVAPHGDTLLWLSESRNKKSVTLDLHTPGGVELLKKLVAVSDVLCENFQPGTLEEWGVGWDVLHAINPRLIMLRISGYGQTGPYAGRPGFGRIANAFGGISFLAGFPDRPPVIPGSATLADYLSGLYGGFGVLTALQARERTGKGQVVDIGLYESIFRVLDELVPAYAAKGYVRERMGPATINACPHSHYPTGDGKWVAIACTSDRIFARLANLMGCGELAEGAWATTRQREAVRDVVDARVSAWTGARTQEEVLDLCANAQVPCGPVASIAEIFNDPQYRARENIVEKQHPQGGSVHIPNVIPRLCDTPGRIDTLGPPLGAHNEAVYGGLLGLSHDELLALANKGAI